MVDQFEMSRMIEDAKYYAAQGHDLDTMMHYIAEDWDLSDADFITVRKEVIFWVGKKKTP